jgi:hypothetical protein
MFYMSDMDVGTSLRSMKASTAQLPLNGTIALNPQWRHCRPQAGIIALVVMTSLSSLMCRHPCYHCNDVVALVVMALLPLMRGCLCRHHNN